MVPTCPAGIHSRVRRCAFGIGGSSLLRRSAVWPAELDTAVGWEVARSQGCPCLQRLSNLELPVSLERLSELPGVV